MLEDFDKAEIDATAEVSIRHWINHFSETGEIKPLEASLLRPLLEAHGADFEKLDGAGYASLSGYSNNAKHLGMKQVWGGRRLEFKTWCEEWVNEYEKTHKTLMPVKFGDKPSKTEGMRQFLGELTAFAARQLEFEEFKKRQEARHFNFRKPKADRVRITIPIQKKPFAPASFPPEFPIAAWAEISSW
jgi:hypothetical protein